MIVEFYITSYDSRMVRLEGKKSTNTIQMVKHLWLLVILRVKGIWVEAFSKSGIMERKSLSKCLLDFIFVLYLYYNDLRG